MRDRRVKITDNHRFRPREEIKCGYSRIGAFPSADTFSPEIRGRPLRRIIRLGLFQQVVYGASRNWQEEAGERTVLRRAAVETVRTPVDHRNSPDHLAKKKLPQHVIDA